MACPARVPARVPPNIPPRPLCFTRRPNCIYFAAVDCAWGRGPRRRESRPPRHAAPPCLPLSRRGAEAPSFARLVRSGCHSPRSGQARVLHCDDPLPPHRRFRAIRTATRHPPSAHAGRLSDGVSGTVAAAPQAVSGALWHDCDDKRSKTRKVREHKLLSGTARPPRHTPARDPPPAARWRMVKSLRWDPKGKSQRMGRMAPPPPLITRSPPTESGTGALPGQ